MRRPRVVRCVPARAHLSLLAVVVIWAGSFSVINALLDDGVAAIDIAILRYAIAAPGFAFILWRARGFRGSTRGDAVRVVAAGVAHRRRLPPVPELRDAAHDVRGIAALVVALAPGITLVLALALGLDRIRAAARRRARDRVRRRRGRRRFRERAATLSVESAKGPLIVLGAPLSFALYNVILKPLLGRHDLLALTAATSLVGIVGLVPLVRGSTVDAVGTPRSATLRSSSISASWRRFSGTSSGTSGCVGLGPTRAVSYAYAISPLAVVFGAIFLDETITLWLVLGGALVVGGIVAHAAGAARALGERRGVAERTLTQRELNRALLARQLLLQRVRLPIPRAVERLGGIQDQYAPNGYIRLCSCLEGFAGRTSPCAGASSVVNATLMRTTIHIVSRRDYWPFAVAIRASQRDWWLRIRGHGRRSGTRTQRESSARSWPTGRGSTRAHRDRRSRVGDGRAVARPRPRPAVGNVGAAPSTPLSDRRGLDRTEGTSADERSTTSFGAILPRSVRRPAMTSRSWAEMKLGDLAPALDRLPLRRFRDEQGRSFWTCGERRCPIPRRPRRCAFSRPGTPFCSSTRAAPGSCRSSTVR